MIMYKDWEGQAAGSITFQVLGFVVLMVGVYLLTVTRDASPGCAAGLRTVLGRPPKLEYSLVRTDEQKEGDDHKDGETV